MASMRSLIRRFHADQRGNIAIMAAGGMILAVCCAALGVDIGTIAADRRKTQSAADLAAIVAASNLTNATNAAQAAITQNNYPASSLLSVELGTYTADPTIPSQNRFVTPATGTANAARVTVQTATPLYFSKFFTGTNNYTIKTTAIAANTAFASFAIGSRLLSLDGGIINSMLGGLLGTTLSLSVMDYQSLINAKIDAFSFLSALATRVNLTGVTYSNVLSSNIKVGDIIAAALSTQQAANGAGSATTALSTISQATTALTTKIVPGSLIDAGPYANLTVGQMPGVGVAVSVYDLVNAVAQIANGTNQISIPALNVNLLGIAGVKLTAAIGARPQGSGWLAVGAQGASVHTAQTRLLLEIQVGGTGLLAAAGVYLPLYVEVASGTATLNAVTCGYPNINTSTVTLGVTPGIINAWIADGPSLQAAMTNFTTGVGTPPPATLVNLLGLITVTGRVNAAMGNTTPTNVSFSYSDIQSQVLKTVTTSNFTSSLTGNLLNNLVLGVTIGPLGILIPGLGSLVGGLVTTLLSGVTGVVDQLLASVLATLGVKIGQADVWVNGIRCDGAVLVN
jgi:uncharacterized membrane protein